MHSYIHMTGIECGRPVEEEKKKTKRDIVVSREPFYDYLFTIYGPHKLHRT